MVTGLLAALDISTPNIDTQLYTPSNGTTVASVTVCLTNRTTTIVHVRVALSTTSSVSAKNYITYDIPVYPGEWFERSGLVLAPGQYLFVRSDSLSVSATAWGYEE